MELRGTPKVKGEPTKCPAAKESALEGMVRRERAAFID